MHSIKMEATIYQELLSKVSTTKKIAFLDVDLTLSGQPEMQQNVRNLFEKIGFFLVFVTSRPYELVISDDIQKKSPGLTRPLAKTEMYKNGKRYHVDLNTIPAFTGLLNPDAVASSTGLELYLKQHNGTYIKDNALNTFPFTSNEWKKNVSMLLKNAAREKIQFVEKVTEDIKNYHNHEADIAPVDYRIQVDFTTLENKKKFIREINAHKMNIPVFFLDDSEPEYNIYSLYIFPKKAENLKANVVDYILRKVAKDTRIPLNTIQTFVSGDSFPDLGMLLYSAKNTTGIFYLSGRSRLTKCFIDSSVTHYLDIPIHTWKKNIIKKNPGIYTFRGRTIFIGDELYPGLAGAESLYQFLQSSYL